MYPSPPDNTPNSTDAPGREPDSDDAQIKFLADQIEALILDLGNAHIKDALDYIRESQERRADIRERKGVLLGVCREMWGTGTRDGNTNLSIEQLISNFERQRAHFEQLVRSGFFE